MKHQDELLDGWRLRSGSTCQHQRFPDTARQRVACLFLEATAPAQAASEASVRSAALNGQSSELATLATEHGLSTSDLCAELRDCQLSLVTLQLTSAMQGLTTQARSPADGPHELQSICSLMSALDELIIESSGKSGAEASNPAEAAVSRGDAVGKKKTLQHEIRTPLQGALLTTELMLEDAAQGDPVAAEDILAVRKSIETAVSILNEFATQGGAH